MILYCLIKLLASDLIANILLLVTAVAAVTAVRFASRQITLNDTIELYAVTSDKHVSSPTNGTTTVYPVLSISNIGSRLIYLDKYIFNGREYHLNSQVLPPTLVLESAIYYIDLPTNGEMHVSVIVLYHDIDKRSWKTEVVVDLINNQWKASSFPRSLQ